MQERSAQIRRMDSIYSSASSVVAWLGEGNDTLDFAMTMFNTMDQELEDHIYSFRVPWPRDLNQHECLKAATRFFENTYWSRIWIIQELAFAINLSIICGEAEIPFSLVQSSIQRILRARPPTDIVAIHHVRNILDIRSGIRERGPVKLLDALQRFRKSKATEDVDRVYGLYSLLR